MSEFLLQILTIFAPLLFAVSMVSLKPRLGALVRYLHEGWRLTADVPPPFPLSCRVHFSDKDECWLVEFDPDTGKFRIAHPYAIDLSGERPPVMSVAYGDLPVVKFM